MQVIKMTTETGAAWFCSGPPDLDVLVTSVELVDVGLGVHIEYDMVQSTPFPIESRK